MIKIIKNYEKHFGYQILQIEVIFFKQKLLKNYRTRISQIFTNSLFELFFSFKKTFKYYYFKQKYLQGF